MGLYEDIKRGLTRPCRLTGKDGKDYDCYYFSNTAGKLKPLPRWKWWGALVVLMLMFSILGFAFSLFLIDDIVLPNVMSRIICQSLVPEHHTYISYDSEDGTCTYRGEDVVTYNYEYDPVRLQYFFSEVEE